MTYVELLVLREETGELVEEETARGFKVGVGAVVVGVELLGEGV